MAMGMHVDGLHPLAVDGDGQGMAHRLPLRARGLLQPAAAKHDGGCGPDAGFQEIAAGGHNAFLPKVFVLWRGAYVMPQRGGKVSALREAEIPFSAALMLPFIAGRTRRPRGSAKLCPRAISSAAR